LAGWSPRAFALFLTIKKPQDVSCTRYGGRPKAGACEFCILLWKTHRHRSVTIEIKNSREAGKSQEEFADFFGGQYEVARA
jgi:hypothetical protein